MGKCFMDSGKWRWTDVIYSGLDKMRTAICQSEPCVFFYLEWKILQFFFFYCCFSINSAWKSRKLLETESASEWSGNREQIPPTTSFPQRAQVPRSFWGRGRDLTLLISQSTQYRGKTLSANPTRDLQLQPWWMCWGNTCCPCATWGHKWLSTTPLNATDCHLAWDLLDQGTGTKKAILLHFPNWPHYNLIWMPLFCVKYTLRNCWGGAMPSTGHTAPEWGMNWDGF